MRLFFAVAGLLVSQYNFAQIGGNSVYEFLRMPYSARIAALGGSQITVRDSDIGLAYWNPAVLNPQMHHQITIQQTAYFAGITHGYVGYGYHLGKIPLTLQGGMQYASYGKFPLTLPDGTESGSFRASDFAFNIGACYQPINRLSFGVNLKTIASYLESYNSVGWAMDLGVLYEDTSKNVAFSLLLKNVGTQFTTYNRDKEMEPLPIDLQVGFSHRLKYIPLRFGVIAHNLHRWGILYDDKSKQDQTLFGNEPPKENKVGKFFDNFFRHFIFNMEFLIGKKTKEFLFIRLAYNHLRRGELSVKRLVGLSGFSFGIGARIKNFRIDYSIASYHFAGASHHFGISMDIKPFLKTNQVVPGNE